MAPLFSKVDSNKLWRDVQNEETLICAEFDKDLFNISKVIGRKTKWPGFFWPTRYMLSRAKMISLIRYDTIRYKSLTWTRKLSIQLYLAHVARKRK